MKKNIEKVFILIIFLLLMIISFNFNTQSTINQNTANAICREYYGETFVCCFKGSSGCTNAVNNEHKGPFFYY